MAKPKHLPEQEIRRLEHLDDAALEAELEKLSPAARAAKFHLLLVAYRLAAAVANTAFRAIEDPTPGAERALRAALRDYAPEPFEAVTPEQRAAALMDVYDTIESWGVPPEFLEAIYQQIEALQRASESST